MQSDSSDAPLSLFGGVDDLAASLLGIKNIRHRKSFLELGRIAPANFDSAELPARLFSLIAANWQSCLSAANRRPSRENWRWWEPKADISLHNASAEVTLERAAITAVCQLGRVDWSNQIPIASGIIAGGGDRRRAIDLVHQRADGIFDFIELKIASDNPVYAAIEILQYGLIWLLSQECRNDLGYSGKKLLEASSVKLSVLAPREYYRGSDLSWLSTGISDGLQALGKSRGVNLSFAFEVFPEWFRWPGAEPSSILPALDDRCDHRPLRLPA